MLDAHGVTILKTSRHLQLSQLERWYNTPFSEVKVICATRLSWSDVPLTASLTSSDTYFANHLKKIGEEMLRLELDASPSSAG